MTEYTTKILFLNKSAKGDRVFIFNDEEKSLGNGVESLLMNIAEVRNVLDSPPIVGGKRVFAKVSVMEPKAKAKDSAKEK